MRFFLIIILLSLTTHTFAQRNSGLKIGYNIGWVSSTLDDIYPYYNNMYDTKTLNTLHIGYSWNIKLTDRYSLQTELIYNKKGNRQIIKPTFYDILPDNEKNAYDIEDKNNLQCLSLPLTLNYTLTSHFFGEIGGEFSLSSSRYSANNNFECSIVTGVGYTTKYADFSMRYLHGITTCKATFSPPSTDNSPTVKSSYTYTDKYRTLQFSLIVPVFKYLKKIKRRE